MYLHILYTMWWVTFSLLFLFLFLLCAILLFCHHRKFSTHCIFRSAFHASLTFNRFSLFFFVLFCCQCLCFCLCHSLAFCRRSCCCCCSLLLCLALLCLSLSLRFYHFANTSEGFFFLSILSILLYDPFFCVCCCFGFYIATKYSIWCYSCVKMCELCHILEILFCYSE